LIAALQPGEELVLTQNDTPVARLVRAPTGKRQPRVPGTMKGKLVIHEDDKDHLKDFAEYM
jgi:antitoxin (DNA-binding transcriptional repressor) of toxin-antitoxin stability system